MEGASSPIFHLSLLGRFELTGPNGVVDLPSKKLAGLLAYLACNAPRPQSREKLSALLWGSHFDAQAKQNLRQALFRLRKVLGDDALESDGEVISLNPAAVLCDVGRFEALIRDGGRDALSAAADLYRGRLIDDVTVSEEGWSDWLASELRIDVIKRILQDGRDPMVIFSRDEDVSIELGDLRSKTPCDCVLRRHVCWRGWFVEERQWIIPQVDNLEYCPFAGCSKI